MALIKDLIDIPKRVHQGDFVLKLTEGVNQAEATLRHYVVTPQLARAFDESLGFIQKAVESSQSKAAYLHGSRIGVVGEFDGDATAAKDVAMHVAAMKPVALTSADVPADLIAKERSVAEGKADEANKELVAAGKPAQSAEITAKRIDGAVQKYLKEVSLADQVFVKAADGKQTVAQMLKAANTNVKGFTLYVVGEGIEKKVDDFAAEVAAQVAAAKAAA